MFVAKTCLLTQFLRESAPTPMEDEVSKLAFKQLESTFQVAPIFQTLNWNDHFSYIMMQLEKQWGTH
jgi:hypothetical protein